MSKRAGLPTKKAMRADRHYVEELTRPADPSIGKLVSIDRLEANPDQPRQDFSGLEELVASVTSRGILEPLLVVRAEGDHFRIVAGERRYRAAQEAKLDQVPVLVLEVSEGEELEVALLENIQRKNLTAFEEADAFRALQKQFGLTHQELAKRLGKGRTAVTETLCLADLSTKVRAACQRADITSKRMLLEVLRAGDEPAQLAMVETISKGNLGREEAREARQGKAPKGKAKPQTWNYKHPENRFKLTLKLSSKEDIPPEELIDALSNLLEDLRKEHGHG